MFSCKAQLLLTLEIILMLNLASLVSSKSVSKDLQSAEFDEDANELARTRRAACSEGDCKNGGICWPGAVTSSTPPCLCPDAYTGTYCTDRINFCAISSDGGATVSNPCQNGGTCSNSDASPWYHCSCVPGYTGTDCEINIDDCASKPCANGLCSDLVNDYSCSCFTGWEGRNCNINHNDCPTGACLNGGRCIDGNGTFTCDCTDTGFAGDKCQSNIDDCASKPCINGLCTDLLKNYSCSCFTGWEGRNCSFNHNDCPTGACLNGGRCIDGNGTFTCDCTVTGFAGDRCQNNIDDCASKPCANGLCTDLVKNYSCSCFTGWEGRSCSVDTDYCLSGPCQNGGVCSDGNSTFTCDCSRVDFQGATCSSRIDDCASSPCQHGGRCTDGVRSFTCDCLPGYEGPTCSVDINECKRFGQPCQNGAVCKDLVADYACTGCPADFGGKNCSVLLPQFSFGISGLVSSASFASLPNASSVSGGDSWTIELRLVTLSRGAFLLLLGDPSDSATTPRLLAMIDHSGRLSAQLLHSNGSHIAALTSSDSVATGSFVSVKISVSISGRSLSLSVPSSVRSASLSSASPLPQLSGQLIIGGFSGLRAAPDSSLLPVAHGSRRSKRSAPTLSSAVASVLPANYTAFRGIISGPKLNGEKPLMLRPVSPSLLASLPQAIAASDSSGVRLGVVSEVCETFSPCRNGATCVDVFYNSYECKCHNGYSGVNCSVDHPDCSPNPCKSGEVCLERSDQANYKLRFLPWPFNGSFSYDLAPGFVCIDSYESRHASNPEESRSSSVVVGALVGALTGVVTAGLAVAVVGLLIRFGYLSRTKPAKYAEPTVSATGEISRNAKVQDVDSAHQYASATEELCKASVKNRQNQPLPPVQMDSIAEAAGCEYANENSDFAPAIYANQGFH
ncbi:hypothetical protein BOX15_Mlig025742g2 [Macrostomum lignano]|uniref:EGF-like domain-containing protein n=1 Tax=Macrostomum lignano TaxID=282301 RepID=A0A267GWD5_9PLAT|nr:hypothetical protein BOX15_Mlig025742g2 [Macrostomum lignano]